VELRVLTRDSDVDAKGNFLMLRMFSEGMVIEVMMFPYHDIRSELLSRLGIRKKDQTSISMEGTGRQLVPFPFLDSFPLEPKILRERLFLAFVSGVES
jgi:hypothetical protein